MLQVQNNQFNIIAAVLVLDFWTHVTSKERDASGLRVN